jgi:hypothetical protein
VSLSPGDLVEVVNTPPPGYAVAKQRLIGRQGIIVSTEYRSGYDPTIGRHDVRFVSETLDVATCLLRKISGPPSDGVDEPTAREVVT